MNKNRHPLKTLIQRRLRFYQMALGKHSTATKTVFTKIRPTLANKPYLQKAIDARVQQIATETHYHLMQSVDVVMETTLTLYIKDHPTKAVSKEDFTRLFLDCRKEFFLSSFKGSTIDTRLSQSTRRLRVNLHKGFQNLYTGTVNGRQDIDSLILSITGKGQQEGGSALRWNSRLLLSEMYRAYQFSAKEALLYLDVPSVEWVNRKDREPNGAIIEEYAEKRYQPKEIPEYPYPCNDSYLIPIYD